MTAKTIKLTSNIPENLKTPNDAAISQHQLQTPTNKKPPDTTQKE